MLIIQLHLRQAKCLVPGQSTILEVSSRTRIQLHEVKRMNSLGLHNLHLELWLLLSLFTVTIVVVLGSMSEAADLEPGQQNADQCEDDSKDAEDNVCGCLVVVIVILRFVGLDARGGWRGSRLSENGRGGGEGEEGGRWKVHSQC